MIEFRRFVRRFDSSLYKWIVLLAGAALIGSLCSTSQASQSKMIITWGGNTPAWNQKLHLNAIRIGCSSAPSSCVQAAQQIANVQHVSRAFLAIRLTPSIGEEGRQYSASSKAAPALYSIGFDDFLSQMERLHTSESHIASMLSAFIEGLKSQNSGLHFGVTVYENELSSPELTSRAMAQVRNQTNFVHLFIHYRVDGPNFATYVRQAKAIFPNAQIIAGSYPVDRIDYLPCSRNQHVACTSSQEISLFKKSFDVQLHLLQDGSVAGIEFYPGDFGNVARSDIWGSPRSCRPGRLPECIANSKQMRKYVGEKLSQFSF